MAAPTATIAADHLSRGISRRDSKSPIMASSQPVETNAPAYSSLEANSTIAKKQLTRKFKACTAVLIYNKWTTGQSDPTQNGQIKSPPTDTLIKVWHNAGDVDEDTDVPRWENQYYNLKRLTTQEQTLGVGFRFAIQQAQQNCISQAQMLDLINHNPNVLWRVGSTDYRTSDNLDPDWVPEQKKPKRKRRNKKPIAPGKERMGPVSNRRIRHFQAKESSDTEIEDQEEMLARAALIYMPDGSVAGPSVAR